MSSADTTAIDYEVVRSRRSTADVIVERDGRVIVRAPEWADDRQVAEVVDNRRYWIYRTLAEWHALNASSVVREYKSGEGFLYLGRAYRLRLVADQEQALKLKNGRFLLRRDLVASDDVQPAKAAFQAFFIAKGKRRIQERVARLAPRVGVEPAGVEVRELGYRWASCSANGELAFHWKCMMAPLTVIDYIVVHELCHLHHRQHTQAFWNEVDKIIPDFEHRKSWLKSHGASLDL